MRAKSQNLFLLSVPQQGCGGDAGATGTLLKFPVYRKRNTKKVLLLLLLKDFTEGMDRGRRMTDRQRKWKSVLCSLKPPLI